MNDGLHLLCGSLPGLVCAFFSLKRFDPRPPRSNISGSPNVLPTDDLAYGRWRAFRLLRWVFLGMFLVGGVMVLVALV